MNVFKHKKIIATVAAVIIYFALTYGFHQQSIAYENDLKKLDVNNDGIYSDDEVTEDQKEIIEKMQNNANGNMAPYTLIPFAGFCGLFIFFGLRFTENIMAKNKT